VLIGNRERIAVDPVSRAELALEVGRPEIVRLDRRRRHHARMHVRASPPAPLDQAASRQQVCRGARRGPPRDARMARCENAQQLARAPERMLAAQRAQQLRELGVDPVRAMMRGSTAIAQTASPLLLEPLNPLVANTAAHAVARTELRHREAITPRIVNELQALFHRGSLQPRHRRSSLNRESPRSLEGVLPMFLDTSVTYVPGLYLRAA
jgi:hypothetical protein